MPAQTKVLNKKEWESCFRQQYPGFRAVLMGTYTDGCLAPLPHAF